MHNLFAIDTFFLCRKEEDDKVIRRKGVGASECILVGLGYSEELDVTDVKRVGLGI